MLTFLSLSICSGVLKVIASGGPAKSLRVTMGAGAHGPSLGRAPGRVGVGSGPAADNATILRECFLTRKTHFKENQPYFFGSKL